MKKIVLPSLLIINFSFFIFHSSLYSQTWQEYDSLRAVYQKNQNYDSALVFAENALLAVREGTGENDLRYANMLTRIMVLSYITGKYTSAIEYCETEVKIRKSLQGEKHPDYATTLNNLAELNRNIGNYSVAEPLLLEARDIYGEVLGHKHPDYANALNNLAILYRGMGNYLAAEPLYLEAKNIWREVKGEKHPDFATTINNLASLYKVIGNYEAAEPLYLQAAKIRKEVLGEKNPIYAATVNNLALLYKDVGQLEDAEQLYLEAKQIFLEVLGRKHPNYAMLISNLAVLYSEMGNYAAAETLCLEANSIRREVLGEKHSDYAISLNNLGYLYTETGRYEVAEPLFLESKNILKEVVGEKHPEYANTVNNLAELYNTMGKQSTAEPLYLEYIAILNEGISRNFAFLSEKEKEMYFITLARRYAAFYSFSLRRINENPEITKTVFNNVVKNKGLLLKSSTATRTAILNSNDTALIDKYNQWIALKKEVSKLYSTEITKRKTNPEELENQANAIEKVLVQNSQEFNEFDKFQNMTWENVRTCLKPGEAAIEFVRFSEGKKPDTVIYCALIVRADSKYPDMVKLCEEKELEKVLGKISDNDFTNVNHTYGTNNSTGEQLYKLIWQPSEKHLQGIKTVYFSPDGLLHKVSFSAIGTGKNTFLCDTYNLKRQSSTSKIVIPEKFSFSDKTTAGLFGGIEYSTDTTSIKLWEYLPGTKRETDNLATVFANKKVLTSYVSGSEANEETFKTTATDCNIIHISTHGFFFPNPETESKNADETEDLNETVFSVFGASIGGYGVWSFVKSQNPLMRSGLAMAYANNVWSQRFPGEGEDGVLTASEVAQLDLHKTQLVVLSACETGLGDIKGSEGVYGLQRAFKMAGAKFLVMSLWQVPDQETEEFMTTFYTKLLDTKDIRKSFIETQTEMRKKYDPFFWAAFVLIE
ncbi:MAG: CHAT domain-containing protein, partial [Bacteroidetes bacterium]|nr:CHAT domain-containing protein [Bacteroidota bacterium]MBU1717731.1 CHAT domain-containing protein [Bacteroidota bacterium]